MTRFICQSLNKKKVIIKVLLRICSGGYDSDDNFSFSIFIVGLYQFLSKKEKKKIRNKDKNKDFKLRLPLFKLIERMK